MISSRLWKRSVRRPGVIVVLPSARGLGHRTLAVRGFYPRERTGIQGCRWLVAGSDFLGGCSEQKNGLTLRQEAQEKRKRLETQKPFNGTPRVTESRPAELGQSRRAGRSESCVGRSD